MLKKPVVLTNGQLEQLQAGDRITLPTVFNRNNANASPLVIGTPVYVSAPGDVDKARANVAGTKDVLGLVADLSIPSATLGAIQTDGLITATTGQWDAVTGQTGGLTTGATYFLSAATAGQMSPTPPSSDGEFVCPLGKALSTTEFEVSVGQTIKL